MVFLFICCMVHLIGGKAGLSEDMLIRISSTRKSERNLGRVKWRKVFSKKRGLQSNRVLLQYLQMFSLAMLHHYR